MFFQPIVLDENGFHVVPLRSGNYPMHWHSDIEILFCKKGTCCVETEEQTHLLNCGDIILVGSCEPHALSSAGDSEQSLISLGFLFFDKDFDRIRNLHFRDPVLRNDSIIQEEIEKITALNCAAMTLATRIELKARVCMVVARLLQSLPVAERVSKYQQDRLFAVLKIQKALDFVALNYSKNVTVEQAAEVSGYEKSSFCRSFKNATNATFHSYLNTYRIKKATILLTESDESISEIAYRVGFSQHKNFCRLFKEINGISPSEYRKKHR